MVLEVEKIKPKHNLWTGDNHDKVACDSRQLQRNALSVITSLTWKNIKLATRCYFQFSFLLSVFVYFILENYKLLNYSDQSQYLFPIEEKNGRSR